MGDLVPSDEPNVMWIVDADLLQFENGNAFNQTYATPNNTEYQEQIHLKFTQKNHAIFSVNNSEEQNIVPIIFGMPASNDFAEQTSYQFPELTGLWTFVNHYIIENVPEQASTESEVLVITNKKYRDIDNDGKEEIYYTVIKFYPHEGLFIGEIICQLEEQNNDIKGPFCQFVDNRKSTDPLNPPIYKMSVGGLGAFRLFGELNDGGTFEAFKINSKDYLSNTSK